MGLLITINWKRILILLSSGKNKDLHVVFGRCIHPHSIEFCIEPLLQAFNKG